jgi:diaminopimelate epimerase
VNVDLKVAEINERGIALVPEKFRQAVALRQTHEHYASFWHGWHHCVVFVSLPKVDRLLELAKEGE